MTFLDRIEANIRAVPVPKVGSLDAGFLDLSVPHWTDEGTSKAYVDYLATSNDVYSVASVRAKMLAKPPIVAYSTGGEQLDTSSEILNLLNRPNPFWTSIRLRTQVGLSLAVWGKTYLVLERGAAGMGRPRELWWVRTDRMTPQVDSRDYITGYAYSPPDGGKPIPFFPEEVVEISYANPINEFTGLAPMSAARLAADVASASLKANRSLLEQGMMGGGFIYPGEPRGQFTDPQRDELERLLEQRFRGKDASHRWKVLKYHLGTQNLNIAPKDAQFVEGMNLTFRQVCRAMGVPPALVGDAEYATLANLSVYERLFWEHTGEYEALFLAAEYNRQLTPAFAGVERIELDLSGIVALQEDENAKWERESGQLDRGAITINEWRAEQGLPPVEWGDQPFRSAQLALPGPAEPTEGPERALAGPRTRSLRESAYDDEEDAIRDALIAVFDRMTDAILRRVRERAKRDPDDAALDPFDQSAWSERTRAAVAARYVAAVEKAMLLEGKTLDISPEELAAALEKAASLAALEGQTRRFADQVTLTTYKRVQDELIKGIRKGESEKQLADRVAWVMGIRKTEARVIARTEVTRAVTTGQLAAYAAAGIPRKRWVTEEDERVRETHAALHGVTIPLGEKFSIGACSGYGPAQSDCPEEDINCRCTLEPESEPEGEEMGSPFPLDVLFDAIFGKSLGEIDAALSEWLSR